MKKNINIFISSTFNDMQSERDIIRKQTVRKLQEELADYHVNIQVTDLRWGVDTLNVDEGEREAKVLHVCMDAIQNSRPYFIALLGERYGWLPSYQSMENIKRTLSEDQQHALGDVSNSMSVTEMEIILGALGNQDLMRHSFFCFRNPVSYNNMSNEKKGLYIDSLSSDESVRKNASRLMKLKERIETECKKANLEKNIIKYDAHWTEQGANGKFDQIESFADQLYTLIYEDVLSDVNAGNTDYNDYLKDAEFNKFLTFVESHTEDFQGRKPLIEKFSKFFLESMELSSVLNGITGYFITGFSGCGKSSLFSVLYQHLTTVASQHSFYILAHAAGISPQSVIAEKMISAWSLRIKRTLGDDIDEEETSNNLTSDPVYEFKQLISRIQAKGLQPIVLIDSLDSFKPSNIIKEFDFLPYNVPFVCTTLTGYADDIIKKHPRFQCYNMDDFRLDDAQNVITSVLKKNYKELPEKLQKQLLGITKENGRPAYESPLWLRMAIDILMELGEEDFNRIHNIQELREDAKIENYLSQTISEFPSEATSLFQYWINQTCRYFNPVLTRQALTYISIAQYGIKEDDMAELIGKEWSQLEFVSLRYWMRNYIQCNNKDHRWFFSHTILRQTLMQQSPEFIQECQNKFFNQLIANLTDDEEEEKKELVHQLIARQETSILHENIEKLESVFIRSFVSEYILSPEVVVIYMHKYIEQYYAEDSYMISDVVRELLNKSIKSEDPLYKKAALELHSYHISCFTDNDFLRSSEFIENYFFANSSLEEHLYFDEDEVEPYLEFFQKLIPVYEKMKDLYGDTKLPWSLDYSYFTFWNHYIDKLKEICRYEKDYHNQYCESISKYLDDYALWCLDNISPDDYYKKAINTIDRGRYLSKEELIGFMQQMQHKMLLLIKNGEEGNDKVQNAIEQARLLIKSYVNLFDSEDDVYETDLMEYLSYLPSPEEKPEYPTYQMQDDFTEEKIIHVSIAPPANDDEEGEWISIDLDNMDPDCFSRKLVLDEDNNEEETDYFEKDTESPTDDDIRVLEQELDNYLKKEKEQYGQYGEEAKKTLREKSQLFRRLALMYLKAGYTEKGNNLLNQLGHLLVGFIINMGDNYALYDDNTTDIIKHGGLLAKLGRGEEQLKQAEALSEALFHSYYHHQGGDAQRRIFNYLLKLYDEYGMTNRKINLLQYVYEIAIRNHIEHRFDSYDLYFHDLGYVRPFFKTLFKELKSAGRIQDAVIALERWVDLCHSNYVDEEDTVGYEDLDNAYDMLASLYDGTPTIIAGMKERGSVFLKDPYIMVCLDDKWGYVNHEGQVVIPLVYSRAWKAEPECLSVSRDGQWGYLDLRGNEIAFLGKYNFQLDVAVPIRKGWGRVCICNNWAEFHIPDVFFPVKVDCNQFFGITDSLTKVRVETEKGYCQDFLLQDGETLLFGRTKHSVKTPNQGVIVADWYNPDEEENDGHHTAIYDMQGNELTRPGRFAVIGAFGKQKLSPAYTVDHHAGYVNRLGQEISSFEYERCRPFACGMGAVCKAGKYPYGRWGFVNEQGEEIVAPQYIDVGDFHEGLAWVCLDNGTRKGYNWRGGKFGFINTQGEMVVPAVYDDVSSFYEGKALVWQDNQALYINKEGEIIAYLPSSQ
ncbi:MAG: WG repeat-containing protein [Prevotella sp.]